jgi:P27 family predicted phage terminase small subunit
VSRVKSAEQRRLEGGTGRNGAVSHRPQPEIVQVGGRATPEELAEPPEHLPADAKDYWRRDVQKLIDVGIVDRVDIGGLEALCIAYARATQAGRVVKSEGLLTQGSIGQLREHPAVRIERDAWNMYQRLAEQYGITPLGRTRLGLADLSRRSMAADLAERLGKPQFERVPAQNGQSGSSGQVVDGTVIDD